MVYANNFKRYEMRRIAVESVSEGGLEALRVTVIVPPGVLAQATPVAERQVEGLMGQAVEAVREHLTRQHSPVAA